MSTIETLPSAMSAPAGLRRLRSAFTGQHGSCGWLRALVDRDSRNGKQPRWLVGESEELFQLMALPGSQWV